MFRFELANLDFKGIEITERVTAERIEYRKDKLRFLCDDFDCTLQQADGYDDTIKKIDDGKGSAVTAEPGASYQPDYVVETRMR
jgi:hypothetical protein